jgi:hypothetical protein
MGIGTRLVTRSRNVSGLIHMGIRMSVPNQRPVSLENTVPRARAQQQMGLAFPATPGRRRALGRRSAPAAAPGSMRRTLAPQPASTASRASTRPRRASTPHATTASPESTRPRKESTLHATTAWQANTQMLLAQLQSPPVPTVRPASTRRHRLLPFAPTARPASTRCQRLRPSAPVVQPASTSHHRQLRLVRAVEAVVRGLKEDIPPVVLIHGFGYRTAVAQSARRRTRRRAPSSLPARMATLLLPALMVEVGATGRV